jgi:hypothetical protein
MEVMTMKNKVGDKVIIDPDLQLGRRGSVTVVEQMIKYKGKTMTIESVEGNYYKLITDSHNWCWSDECFVTPYKTHDEAFVAFVKGEISKNTYEHFIKITSPT